MQVRMTTIKLTKGKLFVIVDYCFCGSGLTKLREF